MAKSDNLRKAKEEKNDEFYTRLEDIEAEISQHKDYVKQFYGKTVLCNCDDPEWSNFFVFFRNHFNQLKLKKLITTHYEKPEEVKKIVKEIDENGDEIEKEITEVTEKPSYKIEWCGEMLNDDPINMITTPLKGNGDFRSEECIEILKEADIVVTNPPFSIAREDFIPLLYKYNKKFIIIGDLNWTAYKTVFPLFRENKIFFGYTNVKEFKTPSGDFKKFGNKTWYTNMDLDKSHEPLILTKNYKGNEDKYPKCVNYPEAIFCKTMKDIPKDVLDKPLIVPLTFLVSYCSEQFDILGMSVIDAPPIKDFVDEKAIYTKGGPAFYTIEGENKYHREYARVIIKRKENKD